jgi:predicted transcriptional regulator
MKNPETKISAVEWKILNSIWELGDTPSVREVWEYLYPQKEKAYTTVQTIMNNLVKKGYLEKKKIGLVNFYSPLKTKDDSIKSEISKLISKAFNNSAPALATYLIRKQDLDLDDIKTMKALLARKEKGLKENKND